MPESKYTTEEILAAPKRVRCGHCGKKFYRRVAEALHTETVSCRTCDRLAGVLTKKEVRP